jgi:hypothetical protein
VLLHFRAHRRQWSIALGLGLLLLGIVALLAVALILRSTFRSVPVAASKPAAPSVDSIAGWMTVRYIARTYDVPEPVLMRALGIDERQARRRTVAGIARAHHTSTDAELARVRAAILAYRAEGGGTPPREPGAQ